MTLLALQDATTFGRTRIPRDRAAVDEADARGETKAPNTMEVRPQVIESMGSEKHVYFGLPKEQAAHLGSVADTTGDEDADGGLADEFDEMMVERVSAGAGPGGTRGCSWPSTPPR
jgi:hypothetical protein